MEMKNTKNPTWEIKPDQSIPLLKALHILTADGKLNQDSRRKLKQVNHLYQFIEPLLLELLQQQDTIQLVDHGAGKSYLGFILYDLFFKSRSQDDRIFCTEIRSELIAQSIGLATELEFSKISFLNTTILDAISKPEIPKTVDIVTALHACDTATDDAITFAIQKQAQFIVLAPCCQAQIAALLRKHKAQHLLQYPLTELWRHPIHTREFGSHLTNVLRCLQLESHGYQVTVTELVGWEHAMKNELIIAKFKNLPRRKPQEKLHTLIEQLDFPELKAQFCSQTLATL
jgi:hypothetical protein